MNKKIYLDIMLNGRFFCQMPYEYCPLFPIKEKEVQQFVEKKRPSLKGKDYSINFSTKRV